MLHCRDPIQPVAAVRQDLIWQISVVLLRISFPMWGQCKKRHYICTTHRPHNSRMELQKAYILLFSAVSLCPRQIDACMLINSQAQRAQIADERCLRMLHCCWTDLHSTREQLLLAALQNACGCPLRLLGKGTETVSSHRAIIVNKCKFGIGAI